MNQVNSKIQTSPQIQQKRIVIIGWNSIARRSYEKLNRRPNYEIIGFVNVEPNAEIIAINIRNKILGNLQDFDKILKGNNINYAIIALDPKDYKRIHEVMHLCRLYNLKYDIVSETYDVVYGHVVEEVFREIFKPGPVTFRRLTDILVSFTLLLLFLPLWILVAIAIKLDSRGTVLYSQERVGLNGRIFRIYKFRTMVSDAEKITGPILAGKEDSRITRIGRFLRKTRLDEIPQLLNVLVGDMSMIGPRPERPYFVEKYTNEIPMYKNRLRAKPGITGYAQVSLGYDEDVEDVRKKIMFDLEYINNSSSLLLNLKIIFKTFLVVLGGRGR